MAETIIYNTVSDVLKLLASIVGKEIKLVSEVENEIGKLQTKVSEIRKLLADAEKKQTTNTEIADWLDKLEEAFYDADDLLDDFSTRVSRRQVLSSRNILLKKVRVFLSISKRFTFYHKVALEIQAIMTRIEAIEKGKKIDLIEGPIENINRETHSVPPDVVIGRDADKIEIVNLLLNDSNVRENVSVVAIVGIGGLGKTTFAQSVYNDAEVTRYFELQKWVCVSDPFDVKLIAQKILGCEADRNLSLQKVQERLKSKINGKRYLLVLDDVWNEDREKWLELRVLLTGGSKGSKILLTTRGQNVANVAGANPSHELEGLSPEDSWSLFESMAFQQVEDVEKLENRGRVSIGREIVGKCMGVPLAIKAIGSLLYSKYTDDEWLLFKNNELLKIAKEQDIIFPILKLSYYHLPSKLKGCFAFCSWYVKDAEIYKQELIQMWIAHGFIRSESESENEQLEAIGHSYFMELVSRSLFQEVRTDELGEIRSCKMHDLVHDVAISVVRPKSSVVNSDPGDISERTRHLSLSLNREIPTPIFRAHKLRTLKIKMYGASGSEMDQVLGNLERLRVLHLDNWKMEVVPSSIRKMKQLRYLDLSGSWIETLPSFVTKLPNLQTLKLNDCRILKDLPRDIKELVSLRHLEFDGDNELSGMPRGLGELTSLVTLTSFLAVSRGQLSELQSLDKLQGKLYIRKTRSDEDSSGNRRRWYVKKGRATTTREGTNYLEAKQYLKTLELWFLQEESDELWLECLRPHPNLKELQIRNYGGVSYPRWMMVDKIALPNLVTIHMFGCLRCKYLPAFGQLPCLQFLTVSFMFSLEYMEENSSSNMKSGGEESCSSSSSIGISQPTFFPSLKQLTLYRLPELKGWWRKQSESEEATATAMETSTHQQPSFPSLSQLTIKHCPNLASIPILQPCLEKLDLNKVNKKLVEEELMMTVSTTPNPTTISSSSSSSLLPLSNLKSPKLHRIEDRDNMQFLQNQSWNLTHLSLYGIGELVCLPIGLQHLTTLTTLRIEYCWKLMGLPEWIDNLTSLEQLDIRDCHKLTSLPEEMRHLTALQQLTISHCGEMLYNRCQRETGEDWPNIAHIPTVNIYY